MRYRSWLKPHRVNETTARTGCHTQITSSIALHLNLMHVQVLTKSFTWLKIADAAIIAHILSAVIVHIRCYSHNWVGLLVKRQVCDLLLQVWLLVFYQATLTTVSDSVSTFAHMVDLVMIYLLRAFIYFACVIFWEHNLTTMMLLLNDLMLRHLLLHLLILLAWTMSLTFLASVVIQW